MVQLVDPWALSEFMLETGAFVTGILDADRDSPDEVS